MLLALTTASFGNQLERPLGDAVVRGDARRCRLVLLAARNMAPAGDRAEPVVADQGCQHDDGRKRHRPPSHSLRPEDGGDHERRDQARGVVEVDRGLGRGRGQQVERELRQCGDEDERSEQAERSKRGDELEQVMKVARAEGRFEDAQRMLDRRLENASGRASDLAVAAVEVRLGAGVEVRYDDGNRDSAPRRSGERDRSPGDGSPVRDRVPHSEARDHERDLLLARRSGEREHGERQQPFLVEVPEREEQERRRERDGMELVQRQPTGRRIEQVGEREAEPGTPRCEVLARQPVDGKRAECDGDRLHDEQQVRARPEPPQGSEEHEDRVDMRGEPGDLLAVEVGHPQRMAVRRRPDGLHHVAEVEAPRDERFVTQRRERGEAGGIRGDRRDEQRARARETDGSAHSSTLDQLAPALTQHRLAGLTFVRCAPARADSASEAGVPGELPDGACERLGIARRNEQRARSVAEELAGGGRVGGDQRRTARERLEGLVRNHASRLGSRSEDAERAAGAPDRSGQKLVVEPRHVLDVRRARLEQAVELPAADDSEVDLRRKSRRGENRLDALKRDQLADEKRGEAGGRLPPRLEETVLRADEAHGYLVQISESGEELGLRAGVGDDDAGSSERAPVDSLERTRGERAGSKTSAIGDERVRQRDQRVEDDRPLSGSATRGRKIEVPRVADDQRVEVTAPPPAPREQPGLRRCEAGRSPRSRTPAVALAVPDGNVLLLHLDANPAKTGDHLRVPRIAALVRPEVQEFQRDRAAGFSRGRTSDLGETVARAEPARPL